MLKTVLFAFSILILNCVVLSQNKTYLTEWGLKGKVRQINYYEGYEETDSKRENPGNRVLSAISVFDRKGNLTVQFGFLGYGNECYYKKNVYSYDSKKGKKETTVYESSKSDVFCLKVPPLLREGQTEIFDAEAPVLIEKTVSLYDRKGRLIQETVFDLDQRIAQESKYEYNARGESTVFKINRYLPRRTGTAGTFEKTMAARITYRDEHRIESLGYVDGKLINKSITYNDARRRQIGSERYRLETDEQNKIVKETLSSRTRTYYRGAKEILDWEIYDAAGNLSQQVYVLTENDKDVLQMDYSPRSDRVSSTKNRGDRLTNYGFDTGYPEIDRRLKYLRKFDRMVESADWIPLDFEATLYKYDAHGNIIQTSVVRINASKKENKHVKIYKKDFIYYP